MLTLVIFSSRLVRACLPVPGDVLTVIAARRLVQANPPNLNQHRAKDRSETFHVDNDGPKKKDDCGC